ncbi:IS1182 family transposase [Phytohabitans sp. ZYX-F-186]|uniref:IS1182 family transposase n=1 Tax=Phytohabitans maris TaxID=3071409 RepID=A0ABU0ZKL1_9ACTN|nr:IS1182 family transposase [Phytohabitans sp. ZYX-F-186]MDQ7907591.1 IS1182 family transposase [Phytohabitans sp. ZYX-F-186]
MQGRSDPDRVLLDAAALVGHLVPAGSVYAFLAEHRLDVFPDGLFADLFPSGKGRPSVPGEVIASVLVLQTLEDRSDSEAMTALRCDLRWKTACGLPIDHEGFHPTTLTVWRNRLRASNRPDRIFEAVRQVVAQTGVLKGKTRRALDSVVLDDAVATQDTVTQLIAAVRRVRRLVPAAADLIAERCYAHDWDDPGKPSIAWDDKAARDALVSVLVNDANTIVAELAEAKLDEPAAQALALLALVAGQDVEPADGSDGTDGRWRIAHRVAEDRVISTVDPQARHAHKTVHHRQDGYKAHVAIEPDTGLFTAGELTMACGEDNHEAVVGLYLLDNDPVDPPPDGFEVLGDSAYGTGEARAALTDAGHTAVIKPGPLTPAVAGGFTLDDFTVDETAGTVTCPNHVTRRITARRTVTFGAACRDCPLQQHCTTSKTGRGLVLHKHHALLRQARHDWATHDDLRDTYRRHRPMVERSIAWLIGPKGRCRKLRYHGVTANDWWLHTRMAALNLRRLINLGLTRHPDGWAIA